MPKSIAAKPLRIRNVIRLRIFLALCLMLACVLIFSCRDKSEKSSYSEIKGFDTPLKRQEIKLPAQTESDPHAGMQMPAGEDPHAGIEVSSPAGNLTWQLPAGWAAFPGTGMFYAILKAGTSENALEVSIVAMAGDAGGLDANVERWLGQIALKPSPSDRAAFIAQAESFRTQGGLNLSLLDFNSQVKDGEAPSMLVGVVKPAEFSFFIKVKGKKSDLEKAKKEVMVFCQSLGWKA